VEGSAPSETEEEPTRSFSVRRTGNVGAPATWDSFTPTIWKGIKRVDDDCTPGQAGTLRREQWKWLERSHCRKTEPQEDETKCSPWKKKK
jgi:hypothetical protein